VAALIGIWIKVKISNDGSVLYFHGKMKIRPEIIWQEPGELERSTYKGKALEKLYKE